MAAASSQAANLQALLYISCLVHSKIGIESKQCYSSILAQHWPLLIMTSFRRLCFKSVFLDMQVEVKEWYARKAGIRSNRKCQLRRLPLTLSATQWTLATQTQSLLIKLLPDQ